MKKIMFVSVHPDDETIGCGGTILKNKKLGNKIYWLNLTDISMSHPFGYTKEFAEHIYWTEAEVSKKYGFEKMFNLEIPAGMLETYETRVLVSKIDEVLNSVKPDELYLPNRSDIHSDHRIGFNAVYACTKNFRKPYIKKILMYETLSETEYAPALSENAFIPNFYVDISDYFDKKLRIMGLYDTEIMPEPYPRSFRAIQALAAFRGSRIGAAYAEAFMLLFERS